MICPRKTLRQHKIILAQAQDRANLGADTAQT